ncbi:3-deoxy-D-manno-octulosonic acid transferase [Ovoidimarina sediminis]|uniref:3-deoxy-D-manno-octulosonic acid transferase n=1 Tax=Ovoidimarina sediminis TaxID=3079856 RepID=UPI00290C33BD|nr:glycosyltransferase N-terminal domain-containing protein [Rhodophyticola sp. MJ-SS7]MDU8942441.1 glycosyltransferase N-terminal domain-containing protein [Rhodophyticola sp. MJ-SS7]
MTGGGQRLWVNIGSGMQANALTALFDRLTEDHPGLEITVTAPRSFDARDALDRKARVQTRPVDIRQIFDRYVDETKPDVAVFAGGDLVLSAVPACRERGIPVILLSARLQDSAGLRQKWSEFRMRARMRMFSHVLAATEGDAARFRAVTGPESRVEVLGELGVLADPPPYDQVEYDALAGMIAGRPAWSAVAVRADEIAAIETAQREASRLSHRLLLIAEPSLPSDGPRFVEELARQGWTAALRSEGADPEEEVQILVADLPGERGLWYRLAPITFLGSSLAPPAGPINPFEAAALGSAIIHGEEMAVTEETGRLRNAGASRIVRSGTELGEALVLLLSPDRCARQAHRAWEVTSAGLEAAERAAEVIGSYLERAPA